MFGRDLNIEFGVGVEWQSERAKQLDELLEAFLDIAENVSDEEAESMMATYVGAY